MLRNGGGIRSVVGTEQKYKQESQKSKMMIMMIIILIIIKIVNKLVYIQPAITASAPLTTTEAILVFFLR